MWYTFRNKGEIIMATINIEQLKAKLESLAKREIATDNEDFEVCVYCGGNYDDAFVMGEYCSKVEFARALLEEFFQ